MKDKENDDREWCTLFNADRRKSGRLWEPPVGMMIVFLGPHRYAQMHNLECRANTAGAEETRYRDSSVNLTFYILKKFSARTMCFYHSSGSSLR